MVDEDPLLPSEVLAELPSGLLLFHLARAVKVGNLSPEKAAATYIEATSQSQGPEDAAAHKEEVGQK